VADAHGLPITIRDRPLTDRDRHRKPCYLPVMAKTNTPKKKKNPHAVALGRKGGKIGGPIGGKARWEGVSAEERQAHARKISLARWRNKSKAKTK